MEDAKPKILTGDPPDDDANAPTTQTRAGADPFDPDVLAAQGMEYEHIAGGVKRALGRLFWWITHTRLTAWTNCYALLVPIPEDG